MRSNGSTWSVAGVFAVLMIGAMGWLWWMRESSPNALKPKILARFHDHIVRHTPLRDVKLEDLELVDFKSKDFTGGGGCHWEGTVRIKRSSYHLTSSPGSTLLHPKGALDVGIDGTAGFWYKPVAGLKRPEWQINSLDITDRTAEVEMPGREESFWTQNGEPMENRIFDGWIATAQLMTIRNQPTFAYYAAQRLRRSGRFQLAEEMLVETQRTRHPLRNIAFYKLVEDEAKLVMIRSQK